jgi:hypothetical protein
MLNFVWCGSAEAHSQGTSDDARSGRSLLTLVFSKAVSDVASLFDKMMEVFVDTGRILPQFKKYKEVLNEAQIRPVLTLFYKEILATYSVQLEFLKHPGMSMNLEPLSVSAIHSTIFPFSNISKSRSELVDRCRLATLPWQDRHHPRPHQGQ